ncbi:MAG: DNA-directed RNA polymerase subunit beta' [Chloroflexi bacterium]|nr:DNA-directed RNA polymerase subunit beta' [Chloroflexota bacterium]
MEIRDIRALRISLASPEQIRGWSYGEVTKPETINYRRLRPEKDGLFCEAIFGPTKDWQCYCGKYKKIRYRGIVCDKCGVEVTHSRVRRERMGHIELATPIAHIWYTRRSPSYLGLLLNISQRNLERILYFAQYIITEIDEDARARALRKLDEEVSKAIAERTKEIQERIDAVEAEYQEKTKDLFAQIESLEKEYQANLDASTNSLMNEAATLQAVLEKYKGKAVPHSIIFTPTETPLLEEGEMVTSKTFSQLRELTQEALGQLEEASRTAKEAALAVLQAQIDLHRGQADEVIQQLQEQLNTIVESIHNEFEPQREELRNLRVRMLLNESRYRELQEKWGKVFKAGMGAEAIYEIVKAIDLNVMAQALRAEIRKTRSKQVAKKAAKRLRLVEALRMSGNRPEWMILTVLPVIPPDLRPMVQLDGGRFATSDLNDLYRRVVNRNNRLKHLIRLQAPEVIVRNEKRMLQEAVDSLIDNSRRGKAISLRGRRQLKSLSDILKGKQGRFRRNLLGKRVDYSGRSVIVVGPQLKLHQCGLPKRMALELFRPFVMHKLVEYNYAINVKGAKRLIEREVPEVWEVLEEVIKTRPVLLNRAPTLHRLGIQAFEPVLVEGNAIQIHPLVCAAFNADFDGDQMAVHVPLSAMAVEEARRLMLSSKNLLKPANAEPLVSPTKDIVLGCYYLTMERDGEEGEGKIFSTYDEVSLAYSLGKVGLHAKIKFYTAPGPRRKPRLIDTTVGRVLFNEILPPELRFVNTVMDKGALKNLVADAYQNLGIEATAELVDRIKDIGFHYATQSGITIGIHDITVPADKQKILESIGEKVAEVERQYRRGLITENEQYLKTVELWTQATEDVTAAVARELDPQGNIGVMANSGATKGGLQPVRQLAGMRGLMADPSGRIIALPIRSNFREGLTALEYFISTHGARKGLADTALRTADAGYLTRRLVDVAQDIIVNAVDCETKGGIWIDRESSVAIGEGFDERIVGRYAAQDIVNPQTGEVIVATNEVITEEKMKLIDAAGINAVRVRSPLTCQLRYGVCAKCYGRDLARGGDVQVGEAVGIIAAQSIGEPGTQLTLRTFHTGGVVGAEDITQGLPRVQELFEARIPKGQAIISDIAGTVELRREGDQRWIRVISSQVIERTYSIPRNYSLLVKDGDMVNEGDPLAKRGQKIILAEISGQVFIEDREITVHRDDIQMREYEVPAAARLCVEDGQQVNAGDSLTEGAINPHEMLAIKGLDAVRKYLLEEIQKVYRSQGVAINDKHIEIIIRQMLRRVRVTSAGDTNLLPGDFIDRLDFEERNAEVIAEGGEPATAQPVLLGITKAALNTESFLSAASFQHTITVLASAAIEGKRDDLHGLKESVIIGKLIPAGTGFRHRVEEAEVVETTEAKVRPTEEQISMERLSVMSPRAEPVGGTE